jgi:hypothetical protein
VRTPDRSRFRSAELALVDRLTTPRRVQAWLRTLPYNAEDAGPTLRTFRGVVRHGEAHCLEAALAAATILEQHGIPPVVLDLASCDELDHVVLLFQRGSRWGSVGHSSDVGLSGRKPVFRCVRDLVYSYVDPYVDGSGRIVAWGVFDLDALTRADWRFAEGNVWSVERALYAAPHVPLATSDRRHARLRRRYLAFRARHPDAPAVDYAGRERWL